MKTYLTITAFLIVIILAALGSACSVTQTNLAGKINGRPISYAVYMDSYRAHYNNFQILNNRVPDADEKEQIRLLTWRDATKHVVLTNYFAKYDIETTAQEVIDTLKNNVPDYVFTSPKFQTNGAFDTRLYLQSLEFDTPENLAPLRQQYKDYLIPIMKLQKYLIKDELLTRDEKKLVTTILQSKADIVWTVIDSNNIEPVVSEDEIQIFYQKNAAQFKLEPYYKLNYVIFKVKPSVSDLSISSVLADSISLELSQGYTLEETVKKHQAFYPQMLLKNAGFIRNNDLDPDIYQMFTLMEDGSYSKPVSDAEGLTIYQLTQRTKSMCSFNTLRIPFVPTQSSIIQQRPHAERLIGLSNSIGFAEAVSEMDMTSVPTGKVTPGDPWMEDSKAVLEIETQILEKQAGYIFAPVYSEKLNAWLVVELLDNHINSIKNLDEVRGAIGKLLAEDKRISMAQYQAEQILAGQTDVPVNASTIAMPGMSTASDLSGQSAENIFYRIMRLHFNGERQQYFQLDKSMWLPKVNNVQTDKDLQVSLTDINRVFSANLPANWFDTWMDSKIRSAKLSIYQN